MRSSAIPARAPSGAGFQVGFVIDFKSHTALAQFIHNFFHIVDGKIQNCESGRLVIWFRIHQRVGPAGEWHTQGTFPDCWKPQAPVFCHNIPWPSEYRSPLSLQSKRLRRSNLRKHSNSGKKSEATTKRAKSRGAVQRDTKAVLAELVGGLKEKLDPNKVAAGSSRRATLIASALCD